MPRPPDQALQRMPGRAQYEMAQHGALVRLGGKDPATFVPEVRSEKWNGKCWLRVRHADADLIHKGAKARDVVHKGRAGVEIDVPGKGRRHRITEGSVKWEIVYDTFADLPEDGVIRFDLDYPLDRLAWHYQPALTVEEIAEGCERPEDVVDSWAAYWPESGRILAPDGTERENYEAGKYAHSYRWKWLAGDGAELWVHHEIAGSEMWGGGPEVLAWAVAHPGPYTLDPTFGYTSAGGTSSTHTNNQLRGYGSDSPASSGTLDSVSLYTTTASNNVTLGVYADSAGNPGAKIIDTAEGTTLAGAWVTLNVDSSEAIAGGTAYWPASNVSVNTTTAYDTVVGKSLRYVNSAYSSGALPAAFPAHSTAADRAYSIYATYTESATGNPWYAYAQQ